MNGMRNGSGERVGMPGPQAGGALSLNFLLARFGNFPGNHVRSTLPGVRRLR